MVYRIVSGLGLRCTYLKVIYAVKVEDLKLQSASCSTNLLDLPFRSAVDVRVDPTLFPVVEVGWGLLQAFEAQAFEWSSLGMATPDSTFRCH